MLLTLPCAGQDIPHIPSPGRCSYKILRDSNWLSFVGTLIEACQVPWSPVSVSTVDTRCFRWRQWSWVNSSSSSLLLVVTTSGVWGIMMVRGRPMSSSTESRLPSTGPGLAIRRDRTGGATGGAATGWRCLTAGSRPWSIGWRAGGASGRRSPTRARPVTLPG